VFCSHCGIQKPKNSGVFCSNCGKSSTSEDASPQSFYHQPYFRPQLPKLKGSAFLLVAGILIIVFFPFSLLGAYFIIGPALAILSVPVSILSFIVGILGIVWSRKPQRAMALFVLGCITVALVALYSFIFLRHIFMFSPVLMSIDSIFSLSIYTCFIIGAHLNTK